MAMFSYFATFTQIAYFPRPVEEKNPVAQWRRDGLHFSITSLEPGGNLQPNMAMSKYFAR